MGLGLFLSPFLWERRIKRFVASMEKRGEARREEELLQPTQFIIDDCIDHSSGHLLVKIKGGIISNMFADA